MKIQIAILSIVSAISGCAEVKETYLRCQTPEKQLARAMGDPTEITEKNGEQWLWYDDQATVVVISPPANTGVQGFNACGVRSYKKIEQP